MPTFSQRYGYTATEKAMTREDMPDEVRNAICTAFDFLRKCLDTNAPGLYRNMERELWIHFCNKRLDDFVVNGPFKTIVATNVINDENIAWYRKLDLVEHAIRHFLRNLQKDPRFNFIRRFVEYLNREFKRLGYAYRVIDGRIAEITDAEEIKEIEKMLSSAEDNVRHHIDRALEAYSKRPNGDNITAIKEAISAVEAYCRELTGKNTLGDALNELQKTVPAFPKVLKDGIVKLYAYTNQPDTGIRHALMDSDGTYVPGNAEARYMLVTCVAFINYLRCKTARV